MAHSQPLAPRPRRARPSRCKQTADGQRYWVLRSGAPWRDMPKRSGNWNLVFVRFSRWSKLGVWDAVSETLASLGPADEEHAIDSTIVRAHQHAAGVKGGIKSMKRSAARAAVSRPKSTSAPNAKGNPLTFDVTPGEVHETRGFDALTELHDRRPAKLLGDKGYDSDEIRADLAKRGIEPCDPAAIKPEGNDRL